MRVQLAPNTTITAIDGKTVLFSKATGDFHGLNDSAAHMLRELLDTDFESTIAKCSGQYKVDPKVIEADLQELVDGLVGLKLVVRV